VKNSEAIEPSLKFDLTIWLRHPDFADVLVRREAPEGLESLGEVEGMRKAWTCALSWAWEP
jgi:hypothetical protein